MKKKEKADIIAKKRSVNAIDRVRDVPKMKFITKMKPPRKSPPRIDRDHRRHVLARIISGA